MIIKANPVLFKEKSLIHPLIRNFDKLVMLNYRDRARISEIIPILFEGKIIFVNINSFIQNNKKLGSIIRKTVIENISGGSITCIGGESFYYSLFRKFDKVSFYTNNELIYNDAIFNSKLYGIEVKSSVVDYNKVTEINSSNTLIINLSKLPLNLIQVINKTKFHNIIIISCKHSDFWKKIVKLTNYKLILRNKLIDTDIKYFITINRLILKP